MAYGYDISGMAAYAKSVGNVLIQDLILGGQSFNQQGVAIQNNIKSTDKLVDFSVGTTYLQATNGDPGALPYSGGTVLNDVDISVVELAMKERYTTGTLNSKITQMQLRSGSDPSQALPYNSILIGLKTKQLGLMNDTLLWQGNTDSGNTNPNTNKFDGWLTQASAATDTISGGTVAPLVSSTAIATVEAIHAVAINTYPAWVDESYMFMSPKNYSIYYRAVFGLAAVVDSLTLNTNNMPTSFVIPGTNCLVQSSQGLIGKDNIIETRNGNLVIGTDMVSEDEYLDLEYLNESLVWRLMAIYKLGAKIARTSEIVMTK